MKIKFKQLMLSVSSSEKNFFFVFKFHNRHQTISCFHFLSFASWYFMYVIICWMMIKWNIFFFKLLSSMGNIRLRTQNTHTFLSFFSLLLFFCIRMLSFLINIIIKSIIAMLFNEFFYFKQFDEWMDFILFRLRFLGNEII
jgi:hypothetical protein